MIEKINSVLDVLRNASLFNPAMGQVVIYSLGGLEDFSYGGVSHRFFRGGGDQSSLTDYRVEEL